MAKQQLTPRLNRLEPNIIIDGGMEIWPEGTSISVANNSQFYGSVLFRTRNTSTGVTLTNARSSTVPSGVSFPFSNSISKTAAGSVVAGTQSRISYFIEGYDAQRINLDSWSLIFWVKSTVASNRSVAITNNSGSHSYVQQYAIAATNTWQLVALNFPALSTCPGTIDKTINIGLEIDFNIVAGSTFQTSSLNQWNAGFFTSGTGEDQTWVTGTTHDFFIAGVMVIPGDWRSLSSNTSAYRLLKAGRNFQEELSMSQRYFEAANIDNNGGVSDGRHFWPGNTPTTTTASATVYFLTQKKSAPTVTVDTTASNWRYYNNAGGAAPSSVSAATILDFTSFNLNFGIASGSAGVSTNIFYAGGGSLAWKADSRF